MLLFKILLALIASLFCYESASFVLSLLNTKSDGAVFFGIIALVLSLWLWITFFVYLLGEYFQERK